MKYLQYMIKGSPFMGVLLLMFCAFPALAEFTLSKSITTGLNIPESVIYDAKNDVYYVSNIQGSPTDKDGQGYISKVASDGTLQQEKWISGLNAPKGMAIVDNNYLLVADIDQVRVFIISTGLPSATPTISVTGATFLNDISADATGNVYVTDSNTSAIYEVKATATEWLKETTQLANINGILAETDRLVVVTTSSTGKGELKAIDRTTKAVTTLATVVESGNTLLDGIASDGQGGYYVSNYNGNKVYQVKADKTVVEVLAGQLSGNPADLTYVATKKQLLIPLMSANALKVFADSATPTTTTNAMTIEQTLSDEGQRNTIAFSALSFLSGTLGSDSFFPPGKVADFWGFQYMRDNDPSEKGHNTDFLTKAANNMLSILNDTQEAQLIALAEKQVDSINAYANKRFLLMKAFRRQLEGDLPTGSTGLDETAVKAYSAELYRLDGEISFERATVMGGILAGLDATQRAALDALKGKGMLDWPDVGDQLDPAKYSHDVHVAVMTYAGDLFSWYLGSVEADVYFAPERQGTYFGSFYMKDAPAMGNPDYTISSTLTGDSGQELLSLLTSDQALLLTGLVDSQRESLQGIVDTREAVATELRKFIAGGTADSATVLSLMGKYGELDGEIVYQYATNFAKVGQSLTDAQKTQITSMRVKIMGDFSSPPAGAFLYSNAIDMPTIANTDFLFGVAATTTDPGTTTTPPTTDTGTTGAGTTTAVYTIVDTGQTTCYGTDSSTTITCPAEGASFYGQDAQYSKNPPSYTDNGDKTITDKVTGLMWSKTPDLNGDGKINSDDMRSFADAKSGASTFNLAGHTDWRLPTIKELYSLMDFSGATGSASPSSTSVPSDAVPYINKNYFDFEYGDTAAGLRYIDAQYWSSTEYVSTTMAGVNSTTGDATAFGVNFADGRIKGYGTTYRVINDGRFVRYVRGGNNYGVNKFTDNGDNTISDSATGLMWMQQDSGHLNAGTKGNGSVNWQEALAWCETLNYANHTDWRLPNAKELQSIVDYTRSPRATSSAAIDPLFKVTTVTAEDNKTNYPFYWTSTTHRDGPDFAVYIAFGEALGCMTPANSTTKVVTDVHGAGAQRSDPKTSNTSIGCGNGPQGDVIRIYNYARCVRDSALMGQVITFNALADKTMGDAPFLVSATGGASGNPVTFTATGNCTIAETTVALTSEGTCTVTASQAGNANYQAAANVSQTFNIKAKVTTPTTPTDSTSSTPTTTVPAPTDTTTLPSPTTPTDTTTPSSPTTPTGTTTPPSPTTPPQEIAKPIMPVPDGVSSSGDSSSTSTTSSSGNNQCPPKAGKFSDVCDANKATITNLEIQARSYLSNATIEGTVTNNGWLSNLKLKGKGTVKGGVLTGFITCETDNILSEIEFKGAVLTGCTLEGSILNTSRLEGKGLIRDVKFGAKAKIKGGRLGGKIIGDAKSPATLDWLEIDQGSELSNVILGKHVALAPGVKLDDSVQFESSSDK